MMERCESVRKGGEWCDAVGADIDSSRTIGFSGLPVLPRAHRENYDWYRGRMALESSRTVTSSHRSAGASTQVGRWFPK